MTFHQTPKVPLDTAEHPITAYLTRLLDEVSKQNDGAVADYIPELAKADPEDLAIAITTVDGQTYAVGTVDREFTIQSVSKPFMYGYALREHGLERVLKQVGVEPTGDPFNSIVLNNENNRPFNPMVNAGAIATSELLIGATREEKIAAQMDLYEGFAGRKLSVDQAVYASESETGNRNRAIAYMMLNSGMIEGPTEAVLDLYFRQCSILVNPIDLSVMAATLAAHGRNPLTGRVMLTPGQTSDVLSVMATCGMYDYAGQWMFDVGLPAKSGVAGSVVAVIPGQLGIAVYSPKLDAVGNSVRGIQVCKRISDDLGLHAYKDRTDTLGIVRRSYRAGDVRSHRIRSEADMKMLTEIGAGVAITEIQGPLFFGSAEKLLRHVLAEAETAEAMILDFRRATYADKAAVALLSGLPMLLAGKGCRLIVTGLVDESGMAFLADDFFQSSKDGLCEIVGQIDQALEAQENRLLQQAGAGPDTPRLSLREMDLFAGLSAEDFAVLEPAISTFQYAKGDKILSEGEEGRAIYLVAKGEVTVTGQTLNGAHSFASIGPGQTFGEMALMDGGKRSATVVAKSDAMVYALSVEEVFRLSQDRPRIEPTLLRNLVRNLSVRLRSANERIRHLD
ncbi:glutaminase A [Donghicola sp. C2-DW-16]|uniref:Glutaminase n=1 Tax=Donghicola mangrovi TaxID=2729614 RepID=A0ABX2PIG1_9RHOB|nr:glutaminase A [Donghicola mangrovi]NVO29295.1 glutaminase A [Donghicola mangrovi]